MGLQPETQIRQYFIKDLIAEGGMGVVWRAWDSTRTAYVAIKVVSNDRLDDPNFKTRFLDEVHRHSRLNHPNIVPVLDVFEQDGQSFCVMQLIEGVSLAGLLQQQADHRLRIDAARPIMSDILLALDYAHQRGIIHRDIKPSNVLLDSDGRAHLIDFGIALAIGEQRRTRTGLTVGTPLYMSPEQIRRPKQIDHRSDVYSAGCVFYEMLTGQPPFLPDPGNPGFTDFTIKEAHIKATPIPPRQLASDIPAEVSRLLLRALEKDPDRRIPGCQEFLRLLGTAGAGQGSWSIFSAIRESRLAQATLIALLGLLLFALIYLLIVAATGR